MLIRRSTSATRSGSGFAWLLQAIRLSAGRGGDRGLTDAFVYMSQLHRVSGYLESAIDIASRAAQLAERIGDIGAVAESRLAMGAALSERGEADAAMIQFELASSIAQQTGLRYQHTRALIELAGVHAKLGSLPLAHDHAVRGLRLARDAGFGVLEGSALNRLAGVSWLLGRKAEAVALAEEALDNHDKTGYPFGKIGTLELLAQMHDPPEAEGYRHAAELVRAEIQPAPAEELGRWRDATGQEAG